jgi:hypothetical protein
VSTRTTADSAPRAIEEVKVALERLVEAEKAIDGPFRVENSLEVDRALKDLESVLDPGRRAA